MFDFNLVPIVKYGIRVIENDRSKENFKSCRSLVFNRGMALSNSKNPTLRGEELLREKKFHK